MGEMRLIAVVMVCDGGMYAWMLWAVYVKWDLQKQVDGVHMTVDRVLVKFIPPSPFAAHCHQHGL